VAGSGTREPTADGDRNGGRRTGGGVSEVSDGTNGVSCNCIVPEPGAVGDGPEPDPT
jgi:hypothetical protein